MACRLLITAINQPAPAFERLVKTDTGEPGSAHRGWDIDVSKWAHDSQSIEHDPPPLITLEDLKHLIHAIHTMQYLLRGIDTLSHILQHKCPVLGSLADRFVQFSEQVHLRDPSDLAGNDLPADCEGLCAAR
jgi:hypothetical protein